MMESNLVSNDPDHSMKPVLSAAIQEAVKWALADCCIDPSREDAAERRAHVILDVNTLTDEELAYMDPLALAQCVVCRLLGSGGFKVNGAYSGNSTVQQVVDACFARPNQDPLGDIKSALGLKE